MQAKPSMLSMAVYTLLATSAQAALANSSSMPPDTFQMSPLGYSGAVNTPTADVLPVASTVFSVTNSIPERARKYPGIGVFGGLNWGFGVLPGLELVGRLTYDGNVQCNEFDKINCQTTARDLSLSGKYQLPFTLPFNSRLAMGFTDYGGTAAVNYRQIYAVGTTSNGPVDLSVGYSKAGSKNALMDGVFGSLTARVTDQLALVLETDTQARRLGAHYLQPLNDDIDLQVGLSRKLSGPVHQQTNQFTAAMRYQLDKKIKLASLKKKPSWQSANIDKIALTLDQRAMSLANRLAEDGFANITISALPAAGDHPLMWWIKADPVGWRKDHQQALGTGLVNWMLSNEAEDSEVVLSLTYMGHLTSSIHTSRSCLQQFALGHDTCRSVNTLPVRFLRGSDLPARLKNAKADQTLKLVSNTTPFAWKPQVELGLNLRSTVGTEFGLADYSAALSLGAQVELDNLGMPEDWKKGWMWHGNVLIPVSHSEDFGKNKPFYIVGHQRTELDQALLSYWRNVDTPWLKNIAVQGSVGSINTYSRGGQLDAIWMNEAGDFRIGATAGAYSRRKVTGERSTKIPALLSMRQSIIPGQWHLEGSYGKFLAGDTGYKITSHHWYGDYRLSFFIRETKGSASTMPKTQFAGFEISLPFGPKTSSVSDIGSVRSQDRWGWGLTTKVGADNNFHTYGYGEIPRPRHGVWSDVTDHDRSGPTDMWGKKDALRGALQNTDQ